MCHGMSFLATALKNIFLDVDIEVKNKSAVVKRDLYSYRQRVRVITVAKISCVLTRMGLVSPQRLVSRIVVDKSTDHAKPHSIC